jgi:hypothetical protein
LFEYEIDRDACSANRRLAKHDLWILDDSVQGGGLLCSSHARHLVPRLSHVTFVGWHPGGEPEQRLADRERATILDAPV